MKLLSKVNAYKRTPNFLKYGPKTPLKKRNNFNLILGTFQKCNFWIESKKLFCRTKHVKAHQIPKFCKILWTRFNITDLQSCQSPKAHLGTHIKISLGIRPLQKDQQFWVTCSCAKWGWTWSLFSIVQNRKDTNFNRPVGQMIFKSVYVDWKKKRNRPRNVVFAL